MTGMNSDDRSKIFLRLFSPVTRTLKSGPSTTSTQPQPLSAVSAGLKSTAGTADKMNVEWAHQLSRLNRHLFRERRRQCFQSFEYEGA